MSSFEFFFWGEKNNGFNVLYHNMKYGLDSSKEFEEFLRESCVVEETYFKLQTKLARYAANCNSRGSFAPFWQVLRTFTEKLSNLHQQLMMSWQELMRDVHKYSTEQQKRHREMKDQEASTQETAHNIQLTVANLQKAKESYHARCYEYEKLKRESANVKDLERAESKMKRAQDEYKNLVDKYTSVRKDFEITMIDSCKRFQELEVKHLQQMKDFIDTYTKSWENKYALFGQVQDEFRSSTQSLTVEKLIESFIQAKGTGTEKPGPIEFVEPDLSALPPASTPPESDRRDVTSTRKDGSDNMSQGSASDVAPKASVTVDRTTLRGLFRSKDRKKDKKSKKHSQDKDKVDTDHVDKTVPQVDEEGYIIRTDNVPHNSEHDSSDSSSDSDSDGEVRRPKISVSIRPIGPNRTSSADNVPDIRNVVLGLRLSPTASRRTPVNDLHSTSSKSSLRHSNDSGNVASKPSEDLIDLDLFSTTDSSANITALSADASSVTSPSINGDRNVSSSTSPSVTSRDLLNSLNPSSGLDDSLTSLSFRHRLSTPTPTGIAPLIAAPVAPTRSSRTSLPNTATARPTGRQTGRQTPDPFRMERTDSTASVNSVSFNTSIPSFGTSRGPSPITIGLSDTIPLAVAFSETVHAYFRGSNRDRCQVKLTGEMVVSFPAGIVRVLMDNPSPNILAFRIKNTQNIEQFIANKLLITEDESQSSGTCRLFSFNMSSLSDHLRRQTEVNKMASYFNIDILKYQIKSQPGAESVPLLLASSWQTTELQAEFNLNFSYNSSALSTPTPLSNVGVMVSVDAPVTQLQSEPPGTWSAETKRAMWKLGDVTATSDTGGRGSVSATFDLTSGHMAVTPAVTAVQFTSEQTTLSGIDFELSGPGFRVSLVKKRIVSGKYLSAPETTDGRKS